MRHNATLGESKLFQAVVSEKEYKAILKDIKKRGITRRVFVIEGLTKEARKDANI